MLEFTRKRDGSRWDIQRLRGFCIGVSTEAFHILYTLEGIYGVYHLLKNHTLRNYESLLREVKRADCSLIEEEKAWINKFEDTYRYLHNFVYRVFPAYSEKKGNRAGLTQKIDSFGTTLARELSDLVGEENIDPNDMFSYPRKVLEINSETEYVEDITTNPRLRVWHPKGLIKGEES